MSKRPTSTRQNFCGTQKGRHDLTVCSRPKKAQRLSSIALARAAKGTSSRGSLEEDAFQSPTSIYTATTSESVGSTRSIATDFDSPATGSGVSYEEFVTHNYKLPCNTGDQPEARREEPIHDEGRLVH